MLSEKDRAMALRAVEIISHATRRGVILRAIGALGVFLSVRDCDRCLRLMSSLGRLGASENIFSDIDLAGYSRHRGEIRKMFERELGYRPDFYVNRLFGDRRLIFYSGEGFKVEIFLDRLEFSHDIDLRGRLELSPLALAPEDLVLSKLQIHEINRKDLIDLASILLKYDICDKGGGGCIDGKRIASILADDWGFWYDATRNLNLLRSLIEAELGSGRVERGDADKILGSLRALMEMIDREPKSSSWLKRSRVGTSKPWYRVVEEIER